MRHGRPPLLDGTLPPRRGSVSGHRAARSVDGKDCTVRWLLGHVIQETARHVGHMDVLGEMADGARGE
ncbi:DUF664 domain-containing protein [Kitasatospora sp. NPDC002965]|uniref:mycothiol transferase n=1 Tax=Kitasatospora sp. NPDC002965 TaxID=3154775 RepID=UPI00339F6D49